MVKVSGYLEKRGQGFVAVVEVPPAKRVAVGAKRLKKGLGTRDKHVAQARLLKALLELHARIEELCRRRPETDPMTAEALAYRDHLQGAKSGGGVYATTRLFDPDTGRDEDIEVEIAGDIIVDEIQSRGEAIQQEQGAARAKAFADMAFGRATPLLHHMETWLAEPGKRGTLRAPRTIREYRGMMEAFRDWLAAEGHGSTVEAVSRKLAGGYVSRLLKDGLSPARIRDIASAFSTYWVWMERRGIAPDGSNPWRDQGVPKVRKREAFLIGEDVDDDEPRPFNTEELVKLFEGVGDNAGLRDLMLLSLLSGLRINEACCLTVGQCAGGQFDVKGTKTKAARRRVPIHPDLTALLQRRTADREPDEWLLPEAGDPDKDGKRGGNMSAAFYRLRLDVGVDDRPGGVGKSRVDFHSFRRWFITETVLAGTPPHVVRQVVGHEQPKNDPTLGTYFKGEMTEAKRSCVDVVKLPAAVREAYEAALAPMMSDPKTRASLSAQEEP
ncbi:MAG: tyrosine-type recombinase/integrase [Novosphingobium sp.]|uniref:tyrosine-type recombinase/integrase n=1 Tax=Novosphingobium sp. TaxID=1874826 RepID=UPI0022CA2ED2|nr:tyrosine-type recombinase/integrase [Novosphingobium sp.]MCZ8035913.1 tyrosine-type recombinase/integrase [Novosphingobium sp.]